MPILLYETRRVVGSEGIGLSPEALKAMLLNLNPGFRINIALPNVNAIVRESAYTAESIVITDSRITKVTRSNLIQGASLASGIKVKGTARVVVFSSNNAKPKYSASAKPATIEVSKFSNTKSVTIGSIQVLNAKPLVMDYSNSITDVT